MLTTYTSIISNLAISDEYPIFYNERCTRVYQLHDIDLYREERN